MAAAQHLKVCSATKAKHRWTFVKNISTAKMSFGPNGSHGTFSVRGFYRCECGSTRVGQSKRDQPGSDLRDHLPGVLA